MNSVSGSKGLAGVVLFGGRLSKTIRGLRVAVVTAPQPTRIAARRRAMATLADSVTAKTR